MHGLDRSSFSSSSREREREVGVERRGKQKGINHSHEYDQKQLPTSQMPLFMLPHFRPTHTSANHLAKPPPSLGTPYSVCTWCAVVERRRVSNCLDRWAFMQVPGARTAHIDMLLSSPGPLAPLHHPLTDPWYHLLSLSISDTDHGGERERERDGGGGAKGPRRVTTADIGTCL